MLQYGRMYDNLTKVTGVFEEKAKRIGGDKAWIFGAKSSQCSEVKSLLARLDSIVGGMPDEEKGKLTKRFTDIVPNGAGDYAREYDDQFLEVLVEILGWGWLKDRYLRHTPWFTMGTPDLLLKNNLGQVIASMECKKIRTSEEDRKYYESQQDKPRQVRNNLTSYDYNKNPFLRKLSDTLCKAEKQINQSGATDRFIFLDLSFDTQFIFPDEKRRIICLIRKLGFELCKKGIMLVSFEQYQVDKLITGAGSL